MVLLQKTSREEGSRGLECFPIFYWLAKAHGNRKVLPGAQEAYLPSASALQLGLPLAEEVLHGSVL